ncbi:DUF2959 domain-containing protein [Aestuariirhabdus sp. Z084]|uniref:DUF2959 domain-containing protein n=1 Tax=Aestuariirhabdus haliotis TaxID=2918751 RepID=UPI00201B3E2D|nr:DUF2959 domain-containing protein [Aestuariirhabdus haliotis]MCL6416602.1 DUF2959 domain-containing protein [Aestuariirhabdus haliotis]MCL6420637.1 DUF2959 domain-containing protein [Aestuariirhabdus haliotis]
MLKTGIRAGMLAVLSIALAGCQSAYYGAMEQVGVHKRDIMVDRVEDARDAQNDAKEQFKSALEQYRSVVTIEDQALADKYDLLNDEYESSRDAAQAVTDRIEAVEDVSEALFDEWREELQLYSNASLRQQSERKLKNTQSKYTSLIKAMRRSEAKMQPVLAALQDQVLFLKHNLNARAIDALKGELKTIQSDVGRLVKEMERSIAESEAFLKTLQEG